MWSFVRLESYFETFENSNELRNRHRTEQDWNNETALECVHSWNPVQIEITRDECQHRMYELINIRILFVAHYRVLVNDRRLLVPARDQSS